jgi:hypothetical protein
MMPGAEAPGGAGGPRLGGLVLDPRTMFEVSLIGYDLPFGLRAGTLHPESRQVKYGGRNTTFGLESLDPRFRT